MESLFKPLQEFERLARNRPHPKIDKAYPKVTDGTLSAIISETPKRYIQQLPTGVVETSLGTWFDLYASWKLTEDIIPQANCQADMLQKSWRAGANSLTYGSQPGYVFFDVKEGYAGADLKLPYIAHVYLQKGKFTDRECDYIFMEAWYQESDIDYLIDSEKKRKKEDPNYKGEWKLDELERIKKNKAQKDEEQQTPNERDNTERVSDDGIRIIHAFQKGVGNKFYSFVPEMTDGGERVAVVRERVNPDPRGVIPIHYLYCNVDFSNPLGRGIAELSGGMQNLLDSHTQSFQYMNALNMNPPLKKKGDIPRGAIKYVPNAIWDMGSNPQNDVEVVSINTQALSNFPNTYGLIKSQILNLNSTQDNSISSEVGNPGFSKTPAGIKSNEARLGVSDNYLRKQYESWFEAISETMLNLTFAEQSGIVEEDLDKRTAANLRKEIPEGNEIITWDEVDENKIYVNYDLLGEEPIYFTADAASSKVNEDNAQVESLAAVKELVVDMLPVSKRMQLANKFIYKLGVEDPEDIIFSEEELEQALQAEQMQQQMMEQQMAMQGQMQDPMQEQAMMEEQMMMEQAMQEEQMAQEQPQLSPEEQELAIGLQERGFGPQQIELAITMLREGYSDEEILQVITQGVA